MVFSTTTGQYGAPPPKQAMPMQNVGAPQPNSMGRYPAPPNPAKQVNVPAGGMQQPMPMQFGAGTNQPVAGAQTAASQQGSRMNSAPRDQNGDGNPDRRGGNNSGGHGGKSPLEKYLAGDETYRTQMSALLQSLQNFASQNRDSRQDIRQDFQRTVQNMGLQKNQDLNQMQGDYASRGLLNSGLYLKDNTDYLRDFQRSSKDLSLDKNRNLTDLLRQLASFRDNTATARANARLEAIRRRAAQYGVL